MMLDERMAKAYRDRSVTYQSAELVDFGDAVAVIFEFNAGSSRAGDVQVIQLSRFEAQKLFNDLWRYAFRPEGMKYCEGDHG